MKPPAVLLAGGRSRRMGSDKALVLLAGRPLIAHAIDRLAAQVGSLAINANAEPAAYAAFGLPVIADAVGGYAGPLAGILAATEWAAGIKGGASVLTASLDTPFLPLDLATRLLGEARAGEAIILARSGGRTHYVCGLWPVSLAADLRQWLATSQDRSMAAWVRRHDVREVAFAGEPDPFFNVNDRRDLAIAEAVLLKLAAEPPLDTDRVDTV